METYPVPGRSPQGITTLKPEPGAKNLHRLIVLIHGGGWVSGNREEMLEIGHFLTDRGFTAATIDYTLAKPGDRWPAQLLDCQAAVRYLRAKAKALDVDPDRIGAAGVSAGGHLSLWLGLTDAQVDGVSSRVQAVGSISGVLDLTKPMTPKGENYHIVEKLLTDDMKPTAEQKRKASPYSALDSTTPPTFLIQGKVDPLVPADQSTETEQKLQHFGRPTELLMVDGMGHGLTPQHAPEREALGKMANWFVVHLR